MIHWRVIFVGMLLFRSLLAFRCVSEGNRRVYRLRNVGLRHHETERRATTGIGNNPEQAPSSIDATQKKRRERVKTTADLRWDIRPVGVVVSPYKQKVEAPKQATISRLDGGGKDAYIQLFPGFEDCLDKLEGFDFIWVLSLMHLNNGFKTKIRPMPREGAVRQPPKEVGLFCSRAPHRPNPIALSALKVTSVDVAKGIVYVKGLDLLDDTPVLDIKPYIPAFDSFPDARAGWMDTICDSVEESREKGYQDIHSARGARAARAAIRKKLEEEEKKEEKKEEVGNSNASASSDTSI